MHILCRQFTQNYILRQSNPESKIEYRKIFIDSENVFRLLMRLMIEYNIHIPT